MQSLPNPYILALSVPAVPWNLYTWIPQSDLPSCGQLCSLKVTSSKHDWLTLNLLISSLLLLIDRSTKAIAPHLLLSSPVSHCLHEESEEFGQEFRNCRHNWTNYEAYGVQMSNKQDLSAIWTQLWMGSNAWYSHNELHPRCRYFMPLIPQILLFVKVKSLVLWTMDIQHGKGDKMEGWKWALGLHLFSSRVFCY